ncbi:MAG: 4Fe-4S dicluster domain-containing protein [Anaerolineae bacterium]|nr:4Fe-4S dicluster domain-containing protein [Anaerolineae bacterium]
MKTIIPVENNDTLAAVRGFLRQLLEAEVVDALLVPMETPAGAITPALVADPDLLDAANPLAPVMGLNAARVTGQVSIREPRGHIGVVLRPCELRALVELVKLKQASLDDLVTIGVDCLGAYDVPVYNGMQADGGVNLAAYLATARSGELAPQEGYAFRDGCQMCEKPHVGDCGLRIADCGFPTITLELFGADLTTGIPVHLSDDVGARLALAPVEDGGQRAGVVDKVIAAHTQVRDERFAEMRQRLEHEGVEGVLAACVRCHNCMTVCPICYCKTCLFKSPTFDHEPMQYVNWARRKGAYRLPADTTLFHLTRLNHMVLSCVGCGMCTSDCPAELPVGLVFRTIGQEVQEAFDYVPGRSVEDPLPMITFREDEWMEVGEE